eukprot:14441934-Ditylum_brightwellii.AAC.1
MDKSQLARLLMTCSTPVASSSAGKILPHHLDQGIPERKEIFYFFLFQCEEGIWGSSSQRLKNHLIAY